MSNHKQLPDGWRWTTFGKVAHQVSESTRDPLEDGFERYIGLEHLDPDSLSIKRWGLIEEDNPTFTKVFHSGQMLFGRRRAYQRKAALANFDGICSGDIIVIEAKSEVLMPELLPFVAQSDGFSDYAIQTSAGSLSPRTKWSYLAKYQFPLPPLDEQRRIAEILWAVEGAIEAADNVIEQIQSYKNILLSQYTLRGTRDHALHHTVIGDLPMDWSLTSIGKVIEMAQYGLSESADSKGKYPIFRMMNIVDGVIIENDMKYIDLTDLEFQTYQLSPGDILFNRTNSIDLVGKVGIYRMQGDHVFASYLIRLRAKSDVVLPEYLNYYLNSEYGQRQIRQYITPGVSQANINAKNLRKVRFPLPPLNEQREIVKNLRALEERIEGLRTHRTLLHNMKKRLMATMLESSLEQPDVQ